MYRYKCTAVENGSKQDFYDVIGQLREMYPELTEDSRVKSDNEFLRREFVRGKNRVMVQYSYSEQSVTVYSEERLEKYYGERQVLEGRFLIHGTATTGTMWVISGIYFAVMAFYTFIIVIFSNYYEVFNYKKIAAVLIMTVIYTSSGIIIKRRKDINLLKLTFCQAGGLISVGAMLVLVNLVILSFYFPYGWFFNWAFLIAMPIHMFVIVFLTIFLPALAISLLLQGAAGLIIKKIHNTKSAKGEDITETM